MPEQIEGTYLCLLDDIHLDDDITLDEFDIGYHSVNELAPLLTGSNGGVISVEMDRLKSYSEFPWASMRKTVSPDEIKTDFDRSCLIHNLAYQHAGMVSWEPFTELIGTLNLLKASPGPVIAKQFYFTLHPNVPATDAIGSVIYGEPSFDYLENGEVRPLLCEYPLERKDVAYFSNLREQLKKCLSKDSGLSNSHLRIAIHYFENGDRRLQAFTLPGSFNAIDPLMSYDAALEALVVREEEKGVADKLSRRVSAIINDERIDTQNFCKRVFWLRSKVSHGARVVEELESLIIDKPNCIINDKARGRSIPQGNYRELIVSSNVFPGFLVNLREVTRCTIRYFCDQFLNGLSREEVLEESDTDD